MNWWRLAEGGTLLFFGYTMGTIGAWQGATLLSLCVVVYSVLDMRDYRK